MGKKNLIILLLIPFLIALLGVMTINSTFNLIENDILSIKWDYDDVEGFKIQNELYELKATPLNLKNYPAGSGNDLIWTLKNKDNTENEYAKIEHQDGKYYLKTINEGEVIITCSNEKGNITRSMTGVIYKNGVVIVTPTIQSSQNNIDSTIYYGEYDLKNGNKEKAIINLNVSIIPSSIKQFVKILNKTDNIEVDLDEKRIDILESGTASLEVGCIDKSIALSTVFSFQIVEEGINVYTYDDLLECTNRSKNGEIVVLRKSFESLDNTYISTDSLIKLSNNIDCFGNYNQKTKNFNFKDDAYQFETTYNQEYITQWNNFTKSNKNYKPITNKLYAGLHVQKDFYGNGYKINFHNLTYPTGSPQEIVGGDGSISLKLTLSETDLFRGPLPFYTLGDPNNLPLVTAYGQDNVGMYVDGSDITINDIDLRNCDFGNNLRNLDTVGNVVEINGDNITIKNSKLKNGKNVVRCFSSNNVTIDNSILEYSRNFLLYLGTNEYIKIDGNVMKDFISLTGETNSAKIQDYLSYKADGDNTLNNYLRGTGDKEKLKNAVTSIQNALNNEGLVAGTYKGSITINDTYFYQSGISSISIDTLFNGPFLYSCSPSLITDIFKQVDDMAQFSVIPLEPVNVSGLSYPLEVNLEGKTKFYDYKNSNTLDLSGLIGENISDLANSLNLYEGQITIDDIFPLKELLFSKAAGYGDTYSSEGTRYMNIAVAYYGGGLNLTKVTTTNLECRAELGSALEINLLESYLNLPASEGTVQTVKNIMLKCVTVVTGFEPFKFICLKGNGYLYNETPKVQDLIDNAKGRWQKWN